MKKKLAVMALAAATLSMMAMPVYADDLVTVGYAQVGHESDWRTANTQNYQDVFSEDAGYSLDLVDCDNDNAAQLEAVRTFISKDMDYIVIAPIQSAGWDTVLQEAQDAGIPVIIADREIEASDDLYDACMRNLHTTSTDPLEIIAWREIYEFFEKCCDTCENVADIIESIVIGNT